MSEIEGQELPEGWEVKKLVDVCFVGRGSSPRPIKKYITESADGVNWIKIGDTKGIDKYIYKTNQKITKEGALKSRYVKEGDFILSNSMSFGRPYIMKTDGYIHDGWFVLHLHDFIDTEYFFQLLSSPYVNDQFHRLASGSVVKNISGDLVKKVILPIPPLTEQKKIVAKLDKAFAEIDKAKTNAERNLKNAKELFESYLKGVFENDNWEETTIDNVCLKIFAGGDKPKNSFSKEKTENYPIPIFANTVKKSGLYGYTNKARVLNSSITVAARGSGTGHTELRNEPFFPIVRLIVLIPNEEMVNLEFLKHTVDNLEILRSGSAIPQLTVPMMKQYRISLPTVSEQKQIVERSDTLSAETKKLELVYLQKITDLEELKKILLQKAFRGEL